MPPSIESSLCNYIFKKTLYKLCSAASAVAFVPYCLASMASDWERSWIISELSSWFEPSRSQESVVWRLCGFVFIFPFSALSYALICQTPLCSSNPLSSCRYSLLRVFDSDIQDCLIRAFRLGVLVTMLPMPGVLRSLCVDAVVAQCVASSREGFGFIGRYFLLSTMPICCGFITYVACRLSLEQIIPIQICSAHVNRRRKYLISFWKRRMGL